MGRDLQKRKRRSSRPAIRQPSSKPKRLLNPLGNDIVAKNWNKKETTTQNYRRLGLVSRLKAPTGGIEHSAEPKSTKPVDPFAIARPTGGGVIISEVRVERDEKGRIIRVLDGLKDNPLNDPLNDLDSDDDMDEEEAEEWDGIDEAEEGTGIFPELENQANQPIAKKAKSQSKREIEWLQRLVEKHGDDTKAMARDRKLNPLQQTEADIARRIQKLKNTSA
ncbi:ribosome biogenesis protein Nop16 [Annulohypoxylon bovei var. microspora]|nr:ribosome biogenesis protein Nop16 [Annulohypoxylon bovei var. microspora]